MRALAGAEQPIGPHAPIGCSSLEASGTVEGRIIPSFTSNSSLKPLWIPTEEYGHFLLGLPERERAGEGELVEDCSRSSAGPGVPTGQQNEK